MPTPRALPLGRGLHLLAGHGAHPLPALGFPLPLPVYKEETNLARISNVVSQPLTSLSLARRHSHLREVLFSYLMAIKCINTHFQFSSTNEISICLLNSCYPNFLFFVPSPLKEAPRSPFYDSLALWERSRVGRRATVWGADFGAGVRGWSWWVGSASGASSQWVWGVWATAACAVERLKLILVKNILEF